MGMGMGIEMGMWVSFGVRLGWDRIKMRYRVEMGPGEI